MSCKQCRNGVDPNVPMDRFQPPSSCATLRGSNTSAGRVTDDTHDTTSSGVRRAGWHAAQPASVAPSAITESSNAQSGSEPFNTEWTAELSDRRNSTDGRDVRQPRSPNHLRSATTSNGGRTPTHVSAAPSALITAGRPPVSTTTPATSLQACSPTKPRCAGECISTGLPAITESGNPQHSTRTPGELRDATSGSARTTLRMSIQSDWDRGLGCTESTGDLHSVGTSSQLGDQPPSRYR